MLLNSRFTQGALKLGLSKAGPLVLALATWCAAHLVAAFGLPAFVDADTLKKIQDGLTISIDGLGTTMLVVVYTWIVHRQSQGVKILKEQLDASSPATPDMDLKSGAVGNNTLTAASIVTGIPIAKAAANAGISLPN